MTALATPATGRYVRQETAISAAINGALSLAFFLLVFGRQEDVALWGPGNWVFDFVPQSFMIGLMGALVPGALTRRRLRGGALAPAPLRQRLPGGLLVRSLLLALASAVLGTGLIALCVLMAGHAQLPFWPALVLKVGYGLALASLVTPIALRAALADPV